MTRQKNQAADVAADISRDHRAFRHEKKENLLARIAEGFVVCLTLGDDQTSLFKALPEFVRAPPQNRSRRIIAVVDHFDHPSEASFLRVFHGCVIDNRTGFDYIGDLLPRQLFYQQAIKDDLPRVVTKVENVIDPSNGGPKLVKSLRQHRQSQSRFHRFECLRLVEIRRCTIVDDISGNSKPDRRLERVAGLRHLVPELTVECESGAIALPLDPSIGIAVMTEQPDQFVDVATHHWRCHLKIYFACSTEHRSNYFLVHCPIGCRESRRLQGLTAEAGEAIKLRLHTFTSQEATGVPDGAEALPCLLRWL